MSSICCRKSVLTSNRADDVLTGLKKRFDLLPDRLNLVGINLRGNTDQLAGYA